MAGVKAKRIDKLIDYWEPRVKSAFRQAVYQMRSDAQLSQIIRMLEQGNVEGAIRAVGLDPVQFRYFDQVVTQAYEAGGQATTISLVPQYSSDGFKTIFRFNIRNPRAENYLANWAASKVTGILADQEMMIREALVNGLEKGVGPRAMALDLVGRVNPLTGRREGGLIGLTSSQSQWVANYREDLESENPAQALSRSLRDRRFDGLVRRAIKEDRPLTAGEVDSMVDSYENRALLFRAQAIARTETIQALHAAQQEAMQQAIDTGALEPNQIGFIWRTAHDDRVRDLHLPMDGQRALLGEYFVDADGNELEYPGDPNAPIETVINCRCWRELDVDYLAGVE